MSKPTTEEATSGHDGFVACICQMHPMLNWGYVSVGEQCGLWTGLLFFFLKPISRNVSTSVGMWSNHQLLWVLLTSI